MVTTKNRLFTIAFPLVTLLVLATQAEHSHAQNVSVDLDSPQSTTLPPDARYEIVQSTLAAKWTFRLDRWTGRVSQLVRTSDDGNMWEEMEVLDLPTIASPSRPRFQLFLSGLAAKFTFLIDNATGKTWTLVTGTRTNEKGKSFEVHSWEPFEE